MNGFADMLVATHAGLLTFMPWHSAWLDDGDGKPCAGSVAIANLIAASHISYNARPKHYAN